MSVHFPKRCRLPDYPYLKRWPLAICDNCRKFLHLESCSDQARSHRRRPFQGRPRCSAVNLPIFKPCDQVASISSVTLSIDIPQNGDGKQKVPCRLGPARRICSGGAFESQDNE